MKILTNHPGQMESKTWNDVSTFRPVNGSGFYNSLVNAIKLHLLKNRFDVVVLGAGRADIIYLLINSLFFFDRKKTVVIDCLWYESESRFYRLIKKIIFKIADYSVLRYIVWASREIKAYSEAFNLDKKKFVFVPYHNTVNNLDIIPSCGDYLFSGGNFGRDYAKLFTAVEGIDAQVLIASTRPEIFKGLIVPKNVIIKGFSHEEYLKKMAGCKINIVALAGGLLHSGGQQTFLNSMYFGKPTIVLDDEGGRDYIENGVDGLLVRAGDVSGLREAINLLLNNPDIASSMGEMAKMKAANFSTEEHFKLIVNECKQVVININQ